MTQTFQFGFTKMIVSDVERLFAFYRDVFGLAEVARVRNGEGEDELDEIIMGPETGAYSPPNLVIQRYPNRPLPPPGELTLGFIVTDLKQTLDAALAAGARVHRPAHDEPEHGVRVAFIKDPDGHLIEMVQMLQAA